MFFGVPGTLMARSGWEEPCEPGEGAQTDSRRQGGNLEPLPSWPEAGWVSPLSLTASSPRPTSPPQLSPRLHVSTLAPRGGDFYLDLSDAAGHCDVLEHTLADA